MVCQVSFSYLFQLCFFLCVLSTLSNILRRQHWTSARRLTDVRNTTSCSRRLGDVANTTSLSTSARRLWGSTKRRLGDVVFRRRWAIFLTSCRRLIIWKEHKHILQGRNHGLKVGGSQQIFFRPREGEEREGRMSKLVRHKFCFVLSYIFL